MTDDNRLKSYDRDTSISLTSMMGLLVILLAGLFILSFTIGRYDVPITDIVRILASRMIPLNATWSENMEIVVMNVRLPRIMMACLVGACLSIAGTVYQNIFHNPMAAPDILGTSSGAGFGAALAIVLNMRQDVITLFAFVSSLISVWLVHLIGQHTRGNQVMNILLAGVMVSSLFSSGTSLVKLIADPSNQLPSITYWMMGSLSGTKMSDVRFAVIPMLIGIIPLLLLRWRINLLSIDENEALSMGINVRFLRVAVILSATFIVAASVSVSGMIGWIGLIAPHLSRRIVGNDCRYLIPSSLIIGSIFLLIADNISRNLLATEIPIGILTAFVGAPFFIYLLTRRR